MSESKVMLVIPEEKVRIQGKIAYIRTGLTVEQLILKLMLFATQDEPVMIVEKEGERMSVKREMVSGIMNEAMRLERNLQCITNALEMLRKVDGSVEAEVCILRLERASAKLNQEITDLFNRYAGEGVKE